MRQFVRAYRAGFLLLTLILLTAPIVHAAGDDLQGRWQLAEQFYEDGSSDLASRGGKIELEVVSRPGEVSVRTWPEGREREAVTWPSMLDIEGAPTMELETRDVSLQEGRMLARYKVRPDDGEGWTLSIEESYSLDEATDRLTGVMTVRMLRDGELSGSYTLRRVFRRVR